MDYLPAEALSLIQVGSRITYQVKFFIGVDIAFGETGVIPHLRINEPHRNGCQCGDQQVADNHFYRYGLSVGSHFWGSGFKFIHVP